MPTLDEILESPIAWLVAYFLAFGIAWKIIVLFFI